jgi:uncharacterized protein YqeY
MSLVQKIDQDLKQSMLAKQSDRTNVLRMLKSAVKYAAIEKHGADGVPTDEEVITAVRKEIKKRQDSIESYTNAKRQDLADKEASEVKILEVFLPAAMSAGEAEELVKQAIAEVGATSKAQMGAVMKAAQAKAAGRVDNKTLSGIVQRLLV